MRLQKSTSKNSCTYYAIQTTCENGKKTTRVYEKIGTEKELRGRGIADPEAYAKRRIREINEAHSRDVMDVRLRIDFSDSLESCSVASGSVCRNIGWAYLKKIFDGLGRKEFVPSYGTKAKYDSYGILLGLVASRILCPGSKKLTVENLDGFLGMDGFSLHDAYRFLGSLNKASDGLQRQLYRKTKERIGTDDSVLYYDCTNFYFETETEDGNEYDENGDILQWGFRRYGASKENRPNPIVQMGLFTDKKGIPVSYCLCHGSNSEQNTVVPLEKRRIRDYKQSRFIYCSDAGLGSYENRAFNVVYGNDYIVTQSLKKREGKELEAIRKDRNWRFLSDNSPASLEAVKKAADKAYRGEELTPEEQRMIGKDIVYKDFPLSKKVTVKDRGKKLSGRFTMEETVHVTFSVKYYLYEKGIFAKQLGRAEKLLGTDLEKRRKGPNDAARRIKTTHVTKDAEAAEISRNEIDRERVGKEERFHGFYAVATSLDRPTQEILAVNKQRWKIEQSFRIRKTEFSSRPVYVSTEEHIRAHFAICYRALLIYRILERRLEAEGRFTAAQILNTLKNMQVIEKDGYYESVYTGSKVLDALEASFRLGLDKKYYRKKKLDKIFE